jgi:hypothetical protein
LLLSTDRFFQTKKLKGELCKKETKKEKGKEEMEEREVGKKKERKSTHANV